MWGVYRSLTSKPAKPRHMKETNPLQYRCTFPSIEKKCQWNYLCLLTSPRINGYLQGWHYSSRTKGRGKIIVFLETGRIEKRDYFLKLHIVILDQVRCIYWKDKQQRQNSQQNKWVINLLREGSQKILFQINKYCSSPEQLSFLRRNKRSKKCSPDNTKNTCSQLAVGWTFMHQTPSEMAGSSICKNLL